MSIRLRAMALLSLLLLLATAGGCELLRGEMGFTGKYMLVASDATAVPNEEVSIPCRARKGDFFLDQEDVAIYYLKDGKVYAIVKTDDEGEGAATFRPTAEGDYPFTVQYYPKRATSSEPLSVDVVVTCREPNTPLFVTDIDKTLTLAESRSREVLEGDPKPMPGAAAALEQLSKDYTIVYLTQRSDYLRVKTRAWFNRHGYPAGPMFMPRLRDIFDGNEKFKTCQSIKLRKQFKGPAYGIGDRTTDAKAYAAAGLQPILMDPISDPNNADYLRDELKKLADLPSGVQVVETWPQVLELVAGKPFPADAAKDKRQKMLDHLTK